MPVNKGMKSSRRVNVKVATDDKNEMLMRLWSFALYGFAILTAVFLVELRVAAILGAF